jgi:hypothetical protein
MKGATGKLVLASLIAVTVATVSDAAAADERASGAASAPFSTLPAGVVPAPPKTKTPAAISANEKVAGFFVSSHNGRKEYVQVTSSAKAAKQLNEGSRGDGLANDTCFMEAEQGIRFAMGMAPADVEPSTWRTHMQPSLSMTTTAMRPGQRVTAIHSERVAEEGSRASLEVVDAWVDPLTKGVRLIGRSSVPLELVTTLMGGTKLYAAREGQSLHVILAMPKDSKRIRHEGLSAIADNTPFNSSCNHIRTTLKAEKGQGQTASFVSTVELPSLDAKDKPAPEPKPDSPATMRGMAEARIRPMHVHASVTWTSREKEPLLTVSAGWDARERTGFVF